MLFKEVPAEVCQNCGEYYLDAEMTEQVLKIAVQAADKSIEFQAINRDKLALN